jgi:hypothetical protein
VKSKEEEKTADSVREKEREKVRGIAKLGHIR